MLRNQFRKESRLKTLQKLNLNYQALLYIYVLPIIAFTPPENGQTENTATKTLQLKK